MTSNIAGSPPSGILQRHRYEIGFVVASLVWAAVIVHTGDVAWPLAMWMATALGPMSLHRRRTGDEHDTNTSGSP